MNYFGGAVANKWADLINSAGSWFQERSTFPLYSVEDGFWMVSIVNGIVDAVADDEGKGIATEGGMSRCGGR